MLISTKEMLLKAQREGYAVPAFNIHNLETVRAVVEVAEELRSPLIIAGTPGTFKFSGCEYMEAIIETASDIASVPIAMHLDHHEDIEDIKHLIRLGCKSVMIDGSHKPLEENISITKEVVEYAHKYDCTVEAELGILGGQEDNLDVSLKDAKYTKPNQASEFVERTGVDSLAIAIGTAHGLYKEEPKLRFDILEKVKELVDVPLVLHGASGVPSEQVKKAISLGICKVNIATELKIPFADAVKKHFNNNPEVNDPRKYLTPGVEAMKEVVREKIMMCGSNNRY